MRIRSIKPSFWQHRLHARISDFEALLALALLNFADDEGRFIADPRGIRAVLFSYRTVTEAQIVDGLKALASERVNWITLYEAPLDGETVTLGYVTNFARHQVVNRPQKSNLPPPPGFTPPGSEPSREQELPLSDDSLNDTGTLHGGSGSGSGSGKKERARATSTSWDLEAIVRLYPVHTDLELSKRAVESDLSAGVVTEEKIREKIGAIAAVIAETPEGANNPMLPSAKRFFGERLWNDDPAMWRTRLQKKGGAARGGNPQWDLKARIKSLELAVAEHPANPDSRAYLGDGAVPKPLSEKLKKIRLDLAELKKKLRDEN